MKKSCGAVYILIERGYHITMEEVKKCLQRRFGDGRYCEGLMRNIRANSRKALGLKRPTCDKD